MEDPLEISVCEPEVEPVDSKEDVMKGESNANNCVISWSEQIEPLASKLLNAIRQ